MNKNYGEVMNKNYIASELLTAAKEVTAGGIEKFYYRQGSDYFITVRGSVGGAKMGNFDKLVRMYNSVYSKVHKTLIKDVRNYKIVGSFVTQEGYVVENDVMYAVVTIESDDDKMSDSLLASLGYRQK